MQIFRGVFMFAVGLLSLIYLANPTAGFIEFLPDNLPGVGNIDEALVAFLLLNSLAYFGLDLRNLFRPKAAQDLSVEHLKNISKN